MSDCCQRTKDSHTGKCADWWEQAYGSEHGRRTAAETRLAAAVQAAENWEKLAKETCADVEKIVASRLTVARAEALEEAARIADSEPELPGEPNEETLAAMIAVGPVANARLAVRTTKECIAERIRALLAPAVAS